MEIYEINKSNSKQKVKSLADGMPVPPFIMNLVAPRKSGKSNLILNMLTRSDMLKNVWHSKDIFIFSPTLEVNDDFVDINVNKISNFDNEIVLTIMKKQKELIKQYGQSKVKPLLLIFDDCLGEKRFATMNSAIEDLAVKGRHLLISVILTCQSLRRISRTIRLNSDYFIIFRLKNQTEYDAVAEEFITKNQRTEFIKQLKKEFETPYNFLVIDLSTNNDIERFRIRFKTPFFVQN